MIICTQVAYFTSSIAVAIALTYISRSTIANEIFFCTKWYYTRVSFLSHNCNKREDDDKVTRCYILDASLFQTMNCYGPRDVAKTKAQKKIDLIFVFQVSWKCDNKKKLVAAVSVRRTQIAIVFGVYSHSHEWLLSKDWKVLCVYFPTNPRVQSSVELNRIYVLDIC